MEGKAGSAGNEWIVAESDGTRVDISQITGIGIQGLTRHTNQLVSANQNQLRVYIIVGFN